ncbi:hypothetical protein O988_02251 [Pseudogymnoascus sp. VKM F-3808]|nr:hypothetical protein V490_06539 [Pseudogymnoascus sp. VKM F-3557]KFY02260.1 hypothetical protein O988_02251 [Pseudogymnoascus sp. VKM F-3808]KFY38932.1 hypothetical protein V495_06293 [Pseudogymnoascus sp. VKM F-4514 (FW-929)]KFY56487.1 hypothetical protein V497_06241 [Pseudogymnoascus sp. VKM F-4516 (FW-969)]
MVPLPLFKLASLFVRHISKYGANRIKIQAHEHPSLRRIAAKYGQTIHQITMRVSVASMRDVAAEKRAKEKAEAPTVKTAEQVKADEEKAAAKAASAAKAAATGTKEKVSSYDPSRSIWTRKFRPIPEAKAVDLFADVIGDAFVLLVAGGLITYEYVKSKSKPDQNTVRIAELAQQLEEEELRVAELEALEKRQQHRVEVLEKALELLKEERAIAKLRTA